jgi:DNA-binding transcriptional MerR regulator
MAVTVKKLAEISGVSVRTLHFYDEIGLLPPGFVANNGYRYYEEEQMLKLQQILFFRELGFELKQIQTIVNQADFDKAQALVAHKKALIAKNKRIAELIQTIDKTIKRLNGEVVMKDKEMFKGFSEEKQAEHEAYLINRFGGDMKDKIAMSKAKVKDWTKSDWDLASSEWNAICTDLKKLLDANIPASDTKVQSVIVRHHDWLKKFVEYDMESYIGVTQGYMDSAWKKTFEPFDEQHPKLAKYFALAAEVFAKRIK